MPRKDFTDVTLILDRSGSMESIKPGTIEGVNAFIKEQQETPGDGCWTLVQFADPPSYSVTYKTIPQDKVQPLTAAGYHTTGHSTALIDAVCRTILETASRLAGLSEADYPSGVLVVIMTDGLQNCDTSFTKGDMNRLIAEHREKYNWQIVFLGAQQDAVQEAKGYGIGVHHANSYAHSNEGARAVLRNASADVRKWKLAGNTSAEQLLLSAGPDPKLVSKNAILPGQPDDEPKNDIQTLPEDQWIAKHDGGKK